MPKLFDFEVSMERLQFYARISSDGTVIAWGKQAKEAQQIAAERTLLQGYPIHRLVEFIDTVIVLLSNDGVVTDEQILAFLENEMSKDEISILKALVTTLRQFIPPAGYFTYISKTDEQWHRRKRDLAALVIGIRQRLADGLSNKEIVSDLIGLEKIGAASEKAVYEALSELPIVQRIIVYPSHGLVDISKKIDMTIRLQPNNEFGICDVHLQVKSSEVGIQNARDKMLQSITRDKLYGIDEVYELQKLLATERKIFISGGQAVNKQQIQENFLSELHHLQRVIAAIENVTHAQLSLELS